ncbi:hypothetical protein QE152_g22104 [Popillia japonica]|uniref:Uncharacterized protein n=1 Tax=Popillia japonica TaxID=7064 RepID=A0AAW1KLT8_POPJA
MSSVKLSFRLRQERGFIGRTFSFNTGHDAMPSGSKFAGKQQDEIGHDAMPSGSKFAGKQQDEIDKLGACPLRISSNSYRKKLIPLPTYG